MGFQTFFRTFANRNDNIKLYICKNYLFKSMRYIIVIDNNTYVNYIDLKEKKFTTSSLLSNALLIGRDLKVKCKRIIRERHTFADVKMLELSKLDHAKLVSEVERSINEQFLGYEPKWSMSDWKNGTEEPALEAIKLAKSDKIDGIWRFDDFSKIVAQILADKYDLKKKEG